MFYGRQIGKQAYDIIDKKEQASLFKNIYKHVTKKYKESMQSIGNPFYQYEGRKRRKSGLSDNKKQTVF